MGKRGKIFYGWKMVAAGSCLQFVQSALIGQTFGAYVAVLREAFGWSKTVLAGASAIQQLESALLGPLQGWIVDRFGPQAMMRFGLLMFAAGFITLSQIESIAGFYVAFMLTALGSSFAGFFTLTLAIVHWFERYRARALAMNSFGMALGGLALPLVAVCMQTFGWRATAFASGIVVLVVGWPLVTMIRGRPEDYGEVIDGRRDPPAAASPAGDEPGARVAEPPQPARVDFTAAQALRTPAFWLISSGHASALLVVTAVAVHAITHLIESLGYSVAQAALVMGIQTAAQIGGIVTGMLIGDRIDKRLASAACMLAHMIGVLLLAYAASAAMLVGFAVLHGFAWGLRQPFMTAIRADYFGRASIGVIIGLSSIVVVVGQVVGPLLAGAMADATGDYRAGFTVLALLAGVGSVLFYFGRPPASPASA
jgi:sugar phosphate permease